MSLSDPLAVASRGASDLFPLRVPAAFAERIRLGDAGDPLLRQVLPVDEELRDAPGFVDDPLSERQFSPVPGVLHKYRGRALLLVTGECAIHCRYCFRRSFPYEQHELVGDRLAAVVDYLAGDPSIREVILSGGDPLFVSDAVLSDVFDSLAGIDHLDSVRIHTRMPIVTPLRIGEGLLEVLTRSRLIPVVVVHCNHANEIDAEVRATLGRLRARGVTLLNQSVLLAGVNDSPDALDALSRTLFAAGVLPYYLHQLDPVAGAAHFAVDDGLARDLMAELRLRLPGYLVPRLVRELPGEASKRPLV